MQVKTKVPIVHQDGTPLMPCSPVKTRKLLQTEGAVKKWTKTGIFYIQLTSPTSNHTQPLALGYDPGAKYDGFCVASEKQMQTSGMLVVENRIKKKLETRRNMRRARRFRKTRRRPARFNNRKNRKDWLPPSIKAKVEMRIAFLNQLLAIYPISQVVVEDVKIDGNRLKGQKGRQYWTWAMVGKTKLYRWLEDRAELSLYAPEDTANVRTEYGLTKIGEKKAHVFESQAVDGLALCISALSTQGKSVTSFNVWRRPENPRRQLHRLEPKKGGIRPPYGGSIAMGFKKNTVVEYKGKLYRTGGTTKGRLSLHSFDYDNRRVMQNAKPKECRKLFVQNWFYKKVV